MSSTPLKSERIIINAPMSFAGAAQRVWRLGGRWSAGVSPWIRRLVVLPLVAVFLLAPWWAAIVGWYIVFGLFLVPYRLLRRGARKRKAEALRHRELLSAVDRNADATG